MKSTELSDRIRLVRHERRMTQEQFAAALGVIQRTVSRWELGQQPVAGYLKEIARLGNVKLAWLAVGEGEFRPSCKETPQEAGALLDAVRKILEAGSLGSQKRLNLIRSIVQ